MNTVWEKEKEQVMTVLETYFCWNGSGPKWIWKN